MDQQKVTYINGDMLNVWNFFEILIYKKGNVFTWIYYLYVVSI